jgi:hypothetical protein
MHSFKEIINNQKQFKKEIILFLKEEHCQTKKILDSIKTDDAYIVKEKNKLKNKFKKIKPENYFERLFFLSSNRSTVFYVWWDKEEKEAKIFKYDKR